MFPDFTFCRPVGGKKDEKKAPRGRFLESGVAELARHMMRTRSIWS